MGVDVIAIITLVQILSIEQDRHGERFFVHECQEKNLLQRKCIARGMLRGFRIIFTCARHYNDVNMGLVVVKNNGIRVGEEAW